jgi:transcriptional accessory protein Tex/SPT6
MAEADWIFDKLLPNMQNDQITPSNVKGKILKVLILIRQQHLDIPMICKYRRYEFMKELEEKDVWLIFNLDQEYAKYKHNKLQILNFLKKVA